MTKEMYLDMCFQLNTSPKDEEIPVEVEDFPVDIQEIYKIFTYLPDKYDSFTGTYHGKSLEYIHNFLELYDLHSNKLFVLKIINLFDYYEKEEITKKLKAEHSSTKAKK
jgi:hypothetical protein